MILKKIRNKIILFSSILIALIYISPKACEFRTNTSKEIELIENAKSAAEVILNTEDEEYLYKSLDKQED